jgi:hypothetical protein
MRFIVLMSKEAVDTYWKWRREGAERRKKPLQRLFRWLRPAVGQGQHATSYQVVQGAEDSTPPSYSEESLLLKKEEAK